MLTTNGSTEVLELIENSEHGTVPRGIPVQLYNGSIHAGSQGELANTTLQEGNWF